MPLAPFVGLDAGSDIPSGGPIVAGPSPLAYAATPEVRDAIASLGRTEDLRLAPGGRRLAIAAAARNRIVLIELEIATAGATPQVALTHAVEISSPCLRYPHGVDFLDDDTLIVASRAGGVAIFDVSSIEPGAHFVELAPLQMLPSTANTPLQRPGSIALLGSGAVHPEILICNNSGNTITKHLLDRDARYAPLGGETLLQKWLDIPDGIAASRDGRWIAVSNHNGYCVMLYENPPGAGRDAPPDGLLRGPHAPHGLRFSPDGRMLFVADAGTPHVHLYTADDAQWRGVRYPDMSIRVIDAERFARGRYNLREGGPKGIDLDPGMRVLVVTCEWQNLAFFDLAPLLAEAIGGSADGAAILRHEIDVLGPVTDMHRRLRAAERQAAQAADRERKVMRRLDDLKRSLSWRLTAPLRWVHGLFSGRR
ncbi:MAG TPA: hypothetical protein VG742_14510 [Dongiaceae bacterium]|nr:hypothetical protein [Dongiaceae bacterium]